MDRRIVRFGRSLLPNCIDFRWTHKAFASLNAGEFPQLLRATDKKSTLRIRNKCCSRCMLAPLPTRTATTQIQFTKMIVFKLLSKLLAPSKQAKTQKALCIARLRAEKWQLTPSTPLRGKTKTVYKLLRDTQRCLPRSTSINLRRAITCSKP